MNSDVHIGVRDDGPSSQISPDELDYAEFVDSRVLEHALRIVSEIRAEVEPQPTRRLSAGTSRGTALAVATGWG